MSTSGRNMNGRPTGIALSTAYLILFGLVFLLFTFLQIESPSELTKSLSRSGILLPLFLLTNIISPIAMIAGGIGIWNKKLWGWYAATLVLGAEISSTLILLVKIPLDMLPVFISSKSIGLITGLLVFSYLTTKLVMKNFGFAFDERSATLKKILGASVALALLVVILSPSLSEQINMQPNSNKAPQPTPKNGAAEF